ncbi:MAG: adenylate kinase [Bacteroidales bacterium]|nr:adenylate kinase [Bacteroidales bacterium]
MLNLIFFGAPGAGKGTQAKKVCEKFNLIHLSTGDILRAKIADKTEMGILAKSYMDKGELVPDDVILKMVENVIKSHPKSNGFIFDGFPRTIPQAEAFDIMLANLNMALSDVIHLKVDKDELIERLKKRAELENRKDDSNISIIENRIVQYIEKTAPVKEYYSNQGKLRKVEGIGDVDEIFEKVVEAIS